MNHVNNDGTLKISARCTLPHTAIIAADLIVTELALVTFESDVLTLTERMPGTTLAEVKAKTTARFVETLRMAAT